METIQIKTYLNTLETTLNSNLLLKSNEIRRFDIESHSIQIGLFEQLFIKSKKAYDGLINETDEVNFYWLDNEEDLVGILNDQDLQYAIDFQKKLCSETILLKIHVFKQSQRINLSKQGKSKGPKNLATSSKLVDQPLLCHGCDQRLIDNKFKSYVKPKVNLCTACQAKNADSSTEDTSKPKKISHTYSVQHIGELGQKGLDNLETLAKKVLTPLNNNVRSFMPGYKMSDLNKPEHNKAKETADVITETVKTNEAFEKEIDLTKEEFKSSVEALDVGSYQIIDVPEIPEKDLSEKDIAEAVRKLETMGIAEAKTSSIRRLIIEKNGDVESVIASYFDKCYEDVKLNHKVEASTGEVDEQKVKLEDTLE